MFSLKQHAPLGGLQMAVAKTFPLLPSEVQVEMCEVQPNRQRSPAAAREPPPECTDCTEFLYFCVAASLCHKKTAPMLPVLTAPMLFELCASCLLLVLPITTVCFQVDSVGNDLSSLYDRFTSKK